MALPGLGAANTRYHALGPLIAEKDYFFVAINQRGISGSTGNLEGLTFHDYANDVAQVIDFYKKSKAHLIGWALGNRIQRMVATDHPEKVATITLLAAGGLVPPTADMDALTRLLTEADIPLEEKVSLARETLFAEAAEDSFAREFANQLTYWPNAIQSQWVANQSTPLEEWWEGGDRPMLIIQGLEDRIAPVGNGRQMKQTYGDRVSLVEIQDAGHLMAFEKPQETAAAILEFLSKHPISSSHTSQ